MKKNLLALILILSLAIIIRTYRLSEVPPSLSWDEASIGYDAWALGVDGKDQWGKSFPYVFQSFGEYKYPIHIYATAISIKLFGLSDLSVRLPSVFMGVINILLLFFLVRRLTNGNNVVALTSTLFLSISPWHIHFSRINWETNFALFFFLAGFLIFLYSLTKPYRLILSFCLFSLSLYTYNAAKIFIPIFVILLTTLYIKSLWRFKKYLLVSLFIFITSLSVNIFIPQLSGTFRLQQISLTQQQIFSTQLFQLTKNRYLGRVELIFGQYLSHFSPQFLFLSGDSNPRHSVQIMGELLWFDAIFIPLGLIFLFRVKKTWAKVLLIWFFLAPLPASLVREAPHASRAMFALGGWQTVSAFGFYSLFNLLKSNFNRSLFLSGLTIIIAASFILYLKIYFLYYPSYSSQGWQYGYKRLYLDYKDKFKDYDRIIISDVYGQPYIFALYYLKYNPNLFRSEVKYNPMSGWGFSAVNQFSNFRFGKIKNLLGPNLGKSLIFVSNEEKLPNLKQKDSIKFLDGTIAFWVYELKT